MGWATKYGSAWEAPYSQLKTPFDARAYGALASYTLCEACHYSTIKGDWFTNVIKRAQSARYGHSLAAKFYNSSLPYRQSNNSQYGMKKEDTENDDTYLQTILLTEFGV